MQSATTNNNLEHQLQMAAQQQQTELFPEKNDHGEPTHDVRISLPSQ
jgi:hypothetical protein